MINKKPNVATKYISTPRGNKVMMYKRRLSACNLPHINVHIPRAFFGGKFWKISNLSVNFYYFFF